MEQQQQNEQKEERQKKTSTTEVTNSGYNHQLADKATSHLDFFNSIDVFATSLPTCGTQIICTIGPACMEVDQMRSLIKYGMKVARFNMSHGTHEYHSMLIDRVREAAKDVSPRAIAVALDTKGPEIRTGRTLNNTPITVETGSVLMLTTDVQYREKCTAEKVFLDYTHLVKSVNVGQKILIADGTVTLKVKRITFENEVECDVLCGATFGSNKNCCLPGVSVELPSLAPKDVEDIKFAVEKDLDMIFVSFVRNASNIKDLRNLLSSCGGEHIQLVSKIENFEGVRNIDEIIDASDGIMVARGDLGMDLPISKVVAAQKHIVAKCILKNKPVICATQMMESMIHNRRPSRAEITDVGNAVLDGVDCVMLSGETANGHYPDIAVKRMRKICREAESIIFYRQMYENIKNSKSNMTDTEGVAMSAASVSYKLHSDAIIVFSTSGRTARQISNFRPKCPIVVVSRCLRVVRQLNLCRGIYPIYYEKDVDEVWSIDVQNRLNFALKEAKRLGVIKPQSSVIFVCGWQNGPGYSNTMRILRIDAGHLVQGLTREASAQQFDTAP